MIELEASKKFKMMFTFENFLKNGLILNRRSLKKMKWDRGLFMPGFGTGFKSKPISLRWSKIIFGSYAVLDGTVVFVLNPFPVSRVSWFHITVGLSCLCYYLLLGAVGASEGSLNCLTLFAKCCVHMHFSQEGWVHRKPHRHPACGFLPVSSLTTAPCHPPPTLQFASFFFFFTRSPWKIRAWAWATLTQSLLSLLICIFYVAPFCS